MCRAYELSEALFLCLPFSQNTESKKSAFTRDGKKKDNCLLVYFHHAITIISLDNSKKTTFFCTISYYVNRFCHHGSMFLQWRLVNFKCFKKQDRKWLKSTRLQRLWNTPSQQVRGYLDDIWQTHWAVVSMFFCILLWKLTARIFSSGIIKISFFSLTGYVDQKGEESLCLLLQMIFICTWKKKKKTVSRWETDPCHFARPL